MTSSWEELTPFEKAREWQRSNPEIADEILAIARKHALGIWEEKQTDAQHRRDMEKSRHKHIADMEKRIWWLQLLSSIASFAAILINGVIAFRYASAGNIGPGLALLGAGGALTAGTYLSGRKGAKQLQASLQEPQAPPEKPAIP